jgi:EAL domain-containing protein (putative c-di-GMP-specific phosphodiesterase class I)
MLPFHQGLQGPTRRHILLVDDDHLVRDIYERLLSHAGHQVESTSEASRALELIERHSFDVVITDISMPDIDGVELVRRIRRLDRVLPVIMVTGFPSVQSASQGVEFGAFRYLVKPVRSAQFLDVIEEAAGEHDLARVKQAALSMMDEYRGELEEKAALPKAFDRTLRALYLVFQPILQLSRREVFAYEALMRSRDEVIHRPAQILHVAEKLGRLSELGRAIRTLAAEALSRLPREQKLFVNLHPSDLDDESLYHPDDPLAFRSDRVVLEITERAQLDFLTAQHRVEQLRNRGYHLALDDLGAGYAGLSSFVQLNPHVVKLDQSLVRDLHLAPSKRKMIRSLCSVCRELEVLVVAEGVETREELAALQDLEIDLIQGYYVGRPKEEFVPVFVDRFLGQPV